MFSRNFTAKGKEKNWEVWCLYKAVWVSIGFGSRTRQIMVAFYKMAEYSPVQFTQSCLGNPMDCSTPGLPVHRQLPEFTRAQVYRVRDAIQPSHPLLSPSPTAFSLSQHQGLFQWVNSSHQVAKVLEFQLQHQSFQWIFSTVSPSVILDVESTDMEGQCSAVLWIQIFY